ncbi:DUF2182 domain-containing protein [Streptomyces spirodelae]|uniref:DUF2182 domain-containing protein n=1 Tax=Streptomyces spirodelae TaxID=2812904 RepID=A0ABS3WW70_9ACTN|nr:DUF2182 domain-containing protein [Streptomyces spirodelae]MBO8187366.1 DUF2182 domain-containing protein [Streptomyces spirodelae]
MTTAGVRPRSGRGMRPGPDAPRGIPAPRTWTRLELLLAGLLLALAGTAWLVTGALAMPDMSSGILTGMRPMGGGAVIPPTAFGFFLLTWVVMMAAMMLPAITPFMVGMRRLLGARATTGTLAALTAGYLAVWGVAGLLGYAVVRAFEATAMGGGPLAVQVGAVVLLVAGAYQFTPLKRWCLVRCRSPLALVMRYAEPTAGSRFGAFSVGVRHGGYCLGCCWALMAVLLAAGVMSLAWMAAVAAVITIEKTVPRPTLTGRLFGTALLALGAALLALP